MSLQISVRECGDVSIVTLRGRSTIDRESELLRMQLRSLIADGKRKLLLDLANLNQVDSSGVSVIVKSYVSLRGQGGELKLLCPRGRVLQVFGVLHLLDVIPNFEDEGQALASFESRSHSASS